MTNILGDRSFADLRTPFATTALDLRSGRRLIFAAGSLVDAVYASAAVPGMFEPLVLDDHVLVDGGWAEPVPVETCHHLGAIHVIAVALPRDDPFTPDTYQIASVLRADALARDLLEEEQLRRADFVVDVETPARGVTDFSDPEGLIAAGERAAEQVIDGVRAVVDRHRSLFVRARE